jgi:thiopeptide-type bacteriocin biosynthesis protein
MSPKQPISNARAKPQSLYEVRDWLFVRTPLFPIEMYLSLGSSLDRFIADPLVQTALAAGSVSLFDALERAGEDEPELPGKLLRYLIRMSSRPTPYGLFAATAIARWGAATDLALLPGRPRTRTRPDMAWLMRFVLELESRPEVRSQLRYFSNPRILLRAGRVFLPEPAPVLESAGPASAVSVRATSVVRRALSLASRPVPHRELVTELAKVSGATPGKAETLIESLWQQTLLLTDLRPPLTDPSPAAYIARRLRDVPAGADALAQLEKVTADLAKWDQMPAGAAAKVYRRFVKSPDGAGIFAAEEAPQVDAAAPIAGSYINRAVGMEALRAAELLLRLTPLPSGMPYLNEYRRAFERRYGVDREVPLLELLDPNFGLGVPWSYGGGVAIEPEKAAIRQQTLHNLAIAALRERRLVVDLDEEMLARLESWRPSPATAPVSLDLSLYVAASSAAGLDQGKFQIIVGPNLGATGAGRNLGRFADLLGDPATVALSDIEEAETAARPGVIPAELVYMPRRFRSANVTIRPHRRPYEIVLGTMPGRSPEHVIPLGDLVVGIRGDRFYLRWPARDTDIAVCAGHMLNNFQAPDVCRFLDDLRRDGQAQFTSFDWGPASGFPVLPRVQSGRVVLSPAQWRIDEATRAELAGSPVASTALREWRARWQVPRYVYLSQGDNRLLLDLEDKAQADQLHAEMRRSTNSGQLVLHEALPAPEHAWLGGPGGQFITEIIVPMVLRPNPGEARHLVLPRSRVAAPSQSDRLRPPGSDWLFAKLYGPRTLEDDLLTGPVARFCQHTMLAGLAEDWFFIRYSDPDPHLRIRFRGNPGLLASQLTQELCELADRLISGGVCSRLCLDTYDRELERFGGVAGMAAAEALFGADSRAVVEILRIAKSGLLTIDMTSLAVISIDKLLAGLGLSEAERIFWYRDRASSRATGGDEYRERKATLRRLLGDPDALRDQPGGDALIRALECRMDELRPVAVRLKALAESGELSQPKSNLLSSFVHLHCNRLLASDRGSEELVLGLLARTAYGLQQAPLAALR